MVGPLMYRHIEYFALPPSSTPNDATNNETQWPKYDNPDDTLVDTPLAGVLGNSGSPYSKVALLRHCTTITTDLLYLQIMAYLPLEEDILPNMKTLILDRRNHENMMPTDGSGQDWIKPVREVDRRNHLEDDSEDDEYDSDFRRELRRERPTTKVLPSDIDDFDSEWYFARTDSDDPNVQSWDDYQAGLDTVLPDYGQTERPGLNLVHLHPERIIRKNLNAMHQSDNTIEAWLGCGREAVFCLGPMTPVDPTQRPWKGRDPPIPDSLGRITFIFYDKQNPNYWRIPSTRAEDFAPPHISAHFELSLIKQYIRSTADIRLVNVEAIDPTFFAAGKATWTRSRVRSHVLDRLWDCIDGYTDDEDRQDEYEGEMLCRLECMSLRKYVEEGDYHGVFTEEEADTIRAMADEVISECEDEDD
jgi:hypothetical protein